MPGDKMALSPVPGIGSGGYLLGMTTSRFPSRRIRDMAPVVGSVLVISLVAGRPVIAEVIGGMAILSVAVLIGINLARRASAEAEPGKRLILDLLMVAVVLVALVGVAVIGMAVPST